MVHRPFQHSAFSENCEISRNPVESSISCSRSCPVQSHPLHAGTAPAHCATEPSLYTPLLPGLGGRLFILYVTKLIIQLLTDYRRPETRLKYINILNIMETERRRRISFSVWILQTLQSSVSTSYIYRYRICGAPHNNVYFIGNLYRRVTCTHRALPRRRRGRGWRQCVAPGYHHPCLGREAQLSISPET